MHEIHQFNQADPPAVDWLVKWNPRTIDVEAVAECLDRRGHNHLAGPACGQARDDVKGRRRCNLPAMNPFSSKTMRPSQ